MDQLSVYEDYMQTMAFLRASRNRLHNAFETSNVPGEPARECLRLCDKMYDAHTKNGLRALELLHKSIVAKDQVAGAQAASTLHRHNRRTVRLSRLFEEDVSDYHPDPDADVDPAAVPKPVNPATPLSIAKFLAKLQQKDSAASVVT